MCICITPVTYIVDGICEKVEQDQHISSYDIAEEQSIENKTFSTHLNKAVQNGWNSYVKYEKFISPRPNIKDLKSTRDSQRIFSVSVSVLNTDVDEDEDDQPVVPLERRLSQWEDLMRKFSQAHKDECKTVSVDIPRAPRSIKLFPTGSTYEGTWDVLGMSGYGTYHFPNGVIYSGEFEDGMFQGEGDLLYPSGAILRGTWKKGHMTERTLIFADGLEYSEVDWMYCRAPDRRFTIEYENGLQPSGSSYLTADQPTREIPPGFYDTGDGFYDPASKIVYNAENINHIVRSPSPSEQKWIVENCRCSPDVSVGPRPHLYEEWSEPQVDPGPPPPPAAMSRSYKPRLSDLSFGSDLGFDDMGSFYYQMARKSRTSFMASRSPSPSEQKWIVENCRCSPDVSVGPRPHLYEEWSEPQVDPGPPPPPAAMSRSYKPRLSDLSFGSDLGFDDMGSFYYQMARKSRTSFMASR